MSEIQLKTGNRLETIRITERDGNKLKVSLGDKEYDLDIARVENNIYSLLSGNKSYDIEVVPSSRKNTYSVKYLCHSFNIEVIDSEMRYMHNRLKSAALDDENIISCPMPGKIVKVMVEEGDKVDAGQVVITVSAMKMESEYKTGKSGLVKEVKVIAGDVVEANIPLIILE